MDSAIFNCLNFAVAIAAFIVSLAAFKIARSAIRYQILVLIHDQMGEKARECNSFLKNQEFNAKDGLLIRDILFSMVTAKQVVEAYLHQYEHWHLEDEKQNILDIYYLQLHTNIRGWLFISKPKDEYGLENDKIKNEQFDTCVKLLEKSNKKYPAQIK